jgi:hypothetical protein
MTSAVRLELVHLRALAKSGRAAAMKATRLRRASLASSAGRAVAEMQAGEKAPELPWVGTPRSQRA